MSTLNNKALKTSPEIPMTGLPAAPKAEPLMPYDDVMTFSFAFSPTDTDEIDLLYRRLLVRLSRFKHLNEIRAPKIIVRNEERLLRTALDQLVQDSEGAALSTRLGFA